MSGQNPPYQTEYAKSARALCKGCEMPIAPKGELKMAVMVPSSFHDGMEARWHHFECFWGRRKVKSEADIRGVDKLRWEDQELIRAKIAGTSYEPSQPQTPKPKPKPVTPLVKFKVEEAKSARAKCHGCQETILKGEARMWHKEKGSGKPNVWYHVSCFSVKAKQLGFAHNPKLLTGFDSLSRNNQLELESILKPEKRARSEEVEVIQTKKVKMDVNGMSSGEERENLDLKEQAEDLWAIRDQLESLKKKDLMALLTENNQQIPSGTDKMLDRLADCMLFGAAQPCTQCRNGQFVFSTTRQGYLCQGNISGFTKCEAVVQEPSRRPFRVPESCHRQPFLAAFQFRSGRKRLFQSHRPPPTSSKDIRKSLPASEKRMMAKSGSRARSWSGAGRNRGSVGSHVTVKNGASVDGGCEIADLTHVYQDADRIKYTATLNRTDVSQGVNSYYKLQLLEHDYRQSYFVYRSWGRLGTSMGDDKLSEFAGDLAKAKAEFLSVYLDKTGNPWTERHRFQKQPNKYFPIDVDYEEEEASSSLAIRQSSQSSLQPAVQSLMKLIFDVEQMKQTMSSFQIDAQKMPLGKLSKNHINMAYSVLTELIMYLETGANERLVLDGTNRFYTLIPHDFGLRKPTLLNTKAKIKKKTEMLDSLLEMEVAYAMLKKKKGSSVDDLYEQLRTEIRVLEKDGQEWRQIVKYVKNTHAATHSGYQLEVEEIFVIEREGEGARFWEVAEMGNRMLLWHGSRTANYAGILSQGLRIAPPEAPPTGYMFGKGIYFADMVSKSANYCHLEEMQRNRTGLLILSEVALGGVWEQRGANGAISWESLPEGKHSVKGLGRTEPNPEEEEWTVDGARVPLGTPHPTPDQNLPLLYNEYIVYKVDQVHMRFLVRAKFNPRL